MFFTTWNIIFMLLYPITNRYIDVLFTSLSTLLISTYFVYIHADDFEFRIKNYKIKVDSIYIQLAHFILHIIPFIIVLYISKGYTIDYMKILLTIFIMYIYFTCVDVEFLYGIKRQEMVLIVILALIIIHL
jgi:hypothetical protein